MSSIEFKTEAFKNINDTQSIHGIPAKPFLAFENEPENIEAMRNAFPDAELYFVEGAFLKEGPVPTKAHRIFNYCN